MSDSRVTGNMEHNVEEFELIQEFIETIRHTLLTNPKFHKLEVLQSWRVALAEVTQETFDDNK